MCVSHVVQLLQTPLHISFHSFFDNADTFRYMQHWCQQKPIIITNKSVASSTVVDVQSNMSCLLLALPSHHSLPIIQQSVSICEKTSDRQVLVVCCMCVRATLHNVQSSLCRHFIEFICENGLGLPTSQLKVAMPLQWEVKHFKPSPVPLRFNHPEITTT